MSTLPEEVKLTDSWKRLILYCHHVLPHGEITLRIVNGEPTELLGEKKKIRFDKERLPLT